LQIWIAPAFAVVLAVALKVRTVVPFFVPAATIDSGAMKPTVEFKVGAAGAFAFWEVECWRCCGYRGGSWGWV